MTRTLLILISVLGLALTVAPSVAVFLGKISWQTHVTLMLLGTVLWFATAPFWMGAARPSLAFWKRRRPV
jgi:hypothetical protein